jgi:hypothetical protein
LHHTAARQPLQLRRHEAGFLPELLRAYGDRRNDLRPLPQNQNPAQAASLPVCPALRGQPCREYHPTANAG